MASTPATNLPLQQTSSSNYANAQATKSNQEKLTSVKIPDGRRNSLGQVLASPTETWKPNFSRKQSWNQEDLKREHVERQLQIDKSAQGGGFTEGGEGSKKI